MKIVALTDLHGVSDFFSYLDNDLTEADLVVITGDITHFGGEKQTQKILSQVEKMNRSILAVPGNCDKKEVNNYLVSKDYSIDCRYKEINEIFFMGVGGSLPCPGTTPNEYSEDEFLTFLESTASYNNKGLPLVFITHQSPFNTINDKLPDGFHIGSHSIRFFIEKYQPLICFCGHVHEGIGIDYIGKSIVVNPGPFRMGSFTEAIINKLDAKAEIINALTR